MAKTLKELFGQAKPVPCGNTWGSLSGDEQKRMCGDCNRNVHNLAELTPQEFNLIQAEGGDRMCVVYEKRPGFWPIFAKPFAAIVTLLMLSQSASAEEVKPIVLECPMSMFTPMYYPPDRECRDECGNLIKQGEWLKKHPEPSLSVKYECKPDKKTRSEKKSKQKCDKPDDPKEASKKDASE